MENAILVLNAGSSSLKFSVFDLLSAGQLRQSITGQVEGIGTAPHLKAKDGNGQNFIDVHWQTTEVANHAQALQHIIHFLHTKLQHRQLLGVGHRVVHGGPDYCEPMLITPAVMTKLDIITPLAPLHNPHNLAAIRAMMQESPDLPQVACFDTAFHRQQDTVAKLFGLPYEYYEHGVQRYGFHGLSYEYIASVLPAEISMGRVIVAHIGSGASLCAIHKGRSVATTMSFTALDGLLMGTRAGSLDAGVILYLLQQEGLSLKQLEDLLYKQSGLLGLSGISNDMRVLLDSDEPRARLAIDYFVYRVSREIGSLAAAMGGVDALVFTAGIGENSPQIRQLVCEQAAWLGVDFDATANQAGAACISRADSRVAVWMLPTNEELMIARHTRTLLGL
ncbi:MAG: acetate/propionate family kinase [Methylococcales bacterium]|nr:acetate/propionate family kinase [Methylococcales bacterium]